MNTTAVFLLVACFTVAQCAAELHTSDQGRISKGDDDLFLNRKMLQTAAQAPSTSQSTSTPSGPITQQQITDQVNQDRQTGEQLQEQNEAKQYSAQAAGAPASEIANMVNQGRSQQEQAQEQREQNEYQLQQQYRNQQQGSSSATAPVQG